MRNLKRVLSLALTLMMALSVMAFSGSASAAGSTSIEIASQKYNDYDAVAAEYLEAIDVTTALNIARGDETGALNPSENLTRAEATAILARMLMGANADNLNNVNAVTKFTDVAYDNWAASYINYCTNQGIISGMTDTTFNPTGDLTGAAFGKMLLVALGYDADLEGYKGNGWETSVTVGLANAGINISGLDLNATLTRETAMEMTFQTLTADMVKYATKGANIILADGTVINSAPSIAEKVTAGANSYTDTADTVQQFCEKYFPNLKLEAAMTGDAFGRPGNNWTYNRTAVSFSAEEAVATYTSKVSNANGLGLNNYDPITSVLCVEDGESKTPITSLTNISDLTGNGVQVEVYASGKAISKVVVINTYFGQVSRVATGNSGSTVTVTRLAGPSTSASTFQSEGFAKDDYVLYTVGSDGNGGQSIQTMTKAEGTTNKITAIGSNYLRLDGIRYDHAANMGGTPGLGDAVVYLDANNYVVYVGQLEGAAAQYLYVLGANKYFDELSIKAMFADGTTQVVTVDKQSTDYSTLIDNLATQVEEQVFPYTVSDGEYKLGTAVTTSADDVNITKNQIALYNDATVSATAATVYVITEDGSTYTGYRNVPSMNTADLIYVVNKDNSSIVDLVFITDDGDRVGDGNGFYFYIAKDNDYERVLDGNTEYTAWTAYVDGVKQTVTAATGLSIKTPGVYKATGVNDKGYVTAIDGSAVTKSLANIKTGAIQATYADNGVLRLDKADDNSKTVYSYDDDTVFVYVSANNAVSAVGSSSIVVKNIGAAKGETITYIYVAEVDQDDTNKAKTVYIVAATKTTEAETIVDTSGFSDSTNPTADELNTALQNASTPVISLPDSVSSVPGDINIPNGKTLVIPDADKLDATTNITGSGTLDVTGDASSSTIDVGANATLVLNGQSTAEMPTITGTGTVTITETVGASDEANPGDLDAIMPALGVDDNDPTAASLTNVNLDSGVYTIKVGLADTVSFTANDNKIMDYSSQLSLSDMAKATGGSADSAVSFYLIAIDAKKESSTILQEGAKVQIKYSRDGGETWNAISDASGIFGSGAGTTMTSAHASAIDSDALGVLIPVSSGVTHLQIIITPKAEG